MKRMMLSVLAVMMTVSLATAAEKVAIPAGEAGAKERLNKTPRHGEWIDVMHDGKPIKCFVVFPERKEKAPVVLVIMEIYGASEWIRNVADQLAADGFIAVVPDLLTGKGPGGGGTDSFPARDAVVAAVRGLQPPEVMKMLDSVRAHAVKLPAANGKSATVGYCWGGSRSFEYAVHQPELNAAVVYYGTSPADASAYGKINAPVLGLYGSDDARVNATIDPAKAAMAKENKKYEVHIYEGAGHGFLRAQDQRNGANLKAAEQAWPRTIEFLRENTK
jgi:carboxymethylenebutenolidase